MADQTITASSVLSTYPAAGTNVDFFHLAGVELTAGLFVYLDSGTPQKWQKVDADLTTGTESTRTFGITLNHAYADQPVAVCLLDPAFVPGFTVTVGVPYYASTTAGAICLYSDLAAGDYVVFVGLGKTATTINLKPTPAGVAI